MKGKKALLNIISGVDSYYRDLLADDFETIYEDLNKLEVLKIFRKYFQISTQKNFDMKSEEYFLFLRPNDDVYNITSANLTEKEYKILKRWINEG